MPPGVAEGPTDYGELLHHQSHVSWMTDQRKLIIGALTGLTTRNACHSSQREWPANSQVQDLSCLRDLVSELLTPLSTAPFLPPP